MSYIDYNKGNTNLIITAPHAGGLKPKGIPKRTYGKLLMDTASGNIANHFLKYSLELQQPYYMIAKIHRSRVDFNRGIVEGAQNNPFAKSLWVAWYNLLAQYTNHCKLLYKQSLYIDLHSHNDNDCIQLGYNLSKEKYLQIKNHEEVEDTSSLRSLQVDLYDLLFGAYSLKVSLESLGYKVYDPKENEVYFNGGKNIEVFGKNGIAAIQIELPVSVIRYRQKDTALNLEKAITAFMLNFVGGKYV